MAEGDCTGVVVGPGGRLTAGELGRHLRCAPTGTVPVDLSRLTFVDPAGLVSLAVIAEAATSRGREVDFRPPTDEDVLTYLARMRLGHSLARLGIATGLPAVQERPLGARVVELRRFEGPSGLQRLLDALVQTYLAARPQLVQPLYAALSEIAENVLEHSGRAHGYLALQRFRRSNAVAFTVGDSGIGLRRRLASRFPVPDDRVAVVRAAEMHVSSIDLPGRGRGIGRVIEITGRHRGEVVMISGRAAGSFEDGRTLPQLQDLPAAHPGTLAHVRLSL